MDNIYNAIQNLYNIDKTTWQEVLAELYNLVSKVENKFDLFELKFGSLLGEQVTRELKKMYDDGSLASLINDKLLKDINTKVDAFNTKVDTFSTKVDTFKTEVSEQLDTNVRELENSKASKVELDIERKRIDSFTSLPEGSTTGDAELIDGRVGADGKTYENIGSAIREQFKNLNKTTDDLLKSYTPITEEVDISILENWIQADGTISSYNNYKHIEISNIKANDTFSLKCQVGVNIRAYVIKNAGGYVTRVYKQENYDTKHDYDLEVTINSDEEGGTLYINTFNSNYIGVKKYNGIEIAPSPEVLDGRIGADGVTYENRGTSIREQLKKVNKVTND